MSTTMAPNENDHRDVNESYNYNSSSDDDEEEDLFVMSSLDQRRGALLSRHRTEDQRRGAMHSNRFTVNSLKQSLKLQGSFGDNNCSDSKKIRKRRVTQEAEDLLQLGTDESAKDWL